MDKQEFLNGLKKHIGILDEGEQRDILDEYTQHIDMKMQRGLSEEEAIRDFGNLEELAADILEAYHVNPDYSKTSGPNPAASEGRRGFHMMRAVCGKAARAAWYFVSHTFPHVLGAGTCKLAEGIAFPFKKLWNLLKKWRVRRREHGDSICIEDKNAGGDITGYLNDTAKKEKKFNFSFQWPFREKKKETRGKKQMETRGSGILFVWKRFWSNIGGGIMWCLRWCWNILVFFTAICLGISAFLSILTFGMSFVFMIAGYPFIGITVAVFGMAVCMVTLTILVWRLMLIKKRDTAEGQEERGGQDDFADETEPLDISEIAVSEEREVEYHA